jgi:predicted phage-related endonuclease
MAKSTKMTESKLLNIIDEYKKVKFEIENLEQILKNNEILLKAELEVRHTDELKVGAFKISNKTYDRTSFDTSRFKEEHPGKYNEYLKKSTYTRFSIK